MDDYDGFVRAHLPGLVRFAFLVCGEREVASDVVQDVLVKAYRHWPRVSAAARDDMWQRLRGLPPRRRAVLVLRYYQQLDDAEIAETLGCSPVTVRGYAHRALSSLRTDLSAELANTPDVRRIKEPR